MSSPFKTAALCTLGCKVNFTETSMISREFEESGVSLVPFDDFSDIYVINTCSVTENADLKCNKLIRKVKKKNPDAYIVITGCYAQLKSEQLATNKDIDLVVGTEDKIDIPNIVMNNLEGGYITSKVKDIQDFRLSYSASDRVRSFIKVQDGCNYNCSFCTIPMARGASRSAKIIEIIDLIQQLESKGFKEIVLSGINLGDFGDGKKETLHELLKTIKDSTKIPRIRISSIEPNLLTNSVIDLLSTSDRFMPHLHIPLQSGSDRILRLMKRRYNKKLYFERVKRIKEKIRNISIGVDVVVGFPTESDEDFQETYNLLKDLEVSYLHVFPYSERDDTEGIKLSPVVPQNIRNERSKKLRQLSDMLRSEFLIKNMDSHHNILVEGIDSNDAQGYTENYIKVKLEGQKIVMNELIKIKPVNCSTGYIRGERV